MLSHSQPNSLARSLLFLLPNRIALVAFELVGSWIGDMFAGWKADGGWIWRESRSGRRAGGRKKWWVGDCHYLLSMATCMITSLAEPLAH